MRVAAVARWCFLGVAMGGMSAVQDQESSSERLKAGNTVGAHLKRVQDGVIQGVEGNWQRWRMFR
jgi:hypothetical protein